MVIAQIIPSFNDLYGLNDDNLLLRFVRLNRYLMLSICNSCRSITCTSSKMLLMFQIFTDLSIDDVMTLFHEPMVSDSSCMMRPK